MGIFINDKKVQENLKLKKATKQDIGRALSKYRECVDIHSIRYMYDALVSIESNWNELTNNE